MKDKDFKSYPMRSLRVSDKHWEELKRRRIAKGLTWNKFIGELLTLDTKI